MVSSKTLLAIDPGTTNSAIVIINREKNQITKKSKLSNIELLSDLKTFMADEAVCEMIACYGMPVGKEVFETVLWIGRFIESSKTEINLVYRRDIKLHLCGSVRAKDGNVRQALIDRWGQPGTKKNPGATYGIKADIWAALAVGTFYMDKTRS
jgi:hypothetical protein